MHPNFPTERGELNLLRLVRERLPQAGALPGLAVPFGDDMAGVPGQPHWLWTTDMLMDGVDFLSDRHAWAAIGRKALAVNLSDCAAMGATPVAALASVALDSALSMSDALALLDGIIACGDEFGCPLVGGDTNSWPRPTVISITILAQTDPAVPPMRRDGARPGDNIYVTGPVGGSILGRHLTFEPRIRLARELNRARRPRAAIDISDGLALDLWRICDASGCGAELDATDLDAATHDDAHRLSAQDGRSPGAHALYDGEDFELILVLAPETPPPPSLIRLGVCTPEPGLRLRKGAGPARPLAIEGWEHFR